LRQLGDVRLGPEIPYLEFQSLSVEARQKLAALAPATMAQAAGIPGVNPVDLQNLIIELEKRPGDIGSRDYRNAPHATCRRDGGRIFRIPCKENH
jgi:tRNA uridine 5-carboxymethylaminomethyl modification enzyme